NGRHALCVPALLAPFPGALGPRRSSAAALRARMARALALAPSVLEQRDRALRQVRDQVLEALDELQGPQHAKEHHQVRAVSGLDALDGALGDARFLGELRLGEIRVDAPPLEPRAELLQNRGIGQLRGEFHRSPSEARKEGSRVLLASLGELYFIYLFDSMDEQYQ